MATITYTITVEECGCGQHLDPLIQIDTTHTADGSPLGEQVAHVARVGKLLLEKTFPIALTLETIESAVTDRKHHKAEPEIIWPEPL